MTEEKMGNSSNPAPAPDGAPDTPREPDVTAAQVARALMGMFASTRTAVVLLGVIAAATILGTFLPNPVALKYVYGRLWFHFLLGLLALNLVACMVWRRRVGLARVWSLLTHLGILLVLVGALVTLVSAERGQLQLAPGFTTHHFRPDGACVCGREDEALGFTVRLKDFRLAFHPPVDRLYAAAKGGDVEDVRLRRDGEVDIPGVDLRVARAAFTPDAPDGAGFVEFTAPGGEIRSVPAEAGTVRELDGEKLVLKMLRYEPGFVMKQSDDGKTVEIGSRGVMPGNPALLVVVVRDGKEEKPRWLFAKLPGFGRMHAKKGEEQRESLDLRFMHPSCPRLEVDLISPSGTRRVRIDNGGEIHSPWDRGTRLRYEREPLRVKEYESEVEVIEKDPCEESDGEHKHGAERVVKRHVIRVNSPLVHKGTKLSQNSCYWMGGAVTVLGVSRDWGVWFVYAGFLAGTLGVMGRFYLAPVLKGLRTRRRGEGQ